ncbi:MAG: hypothetical protein JWO30_2369 [Fibrobacteres bacterium]|nr:hypothetical protein [Fibrobacterota bacterium]
MKKVLWLVSAAFVYAASGADLFVATTGDDNAAGSAQAPYKTLAKAKAAVRQMIPSASGPINVWLRGGTYYQDSTLTFTTADGGSAATPITYSAYRGEKVILSGGLKVTSAWAAGSGNIMVTTIAPNLKVDQLFLNGTRQVLARYPNFDPNSINSLNGSSGDVLGAARVGRWSNPTEGPGYVRGLHSMTWGGESYIITGKNGSGVTQKWVGDNNRGSAMSANNCVVENIFEELDAPGEWYYKKPTGQLYFYPPAGTNLGSATVELASLDELIRITGTAAAKVKYLTFNRLTFTHTYRTLFSKTYELLLRGDWGVARAGAVFIQDAENITVKHCFFDQLGGNGVFMSGYNRNHLVYNNEFTNTGASCVLSVGLQSAVRTPSTWAAPRNSIADQTPGPLTNDYPQGIVIDNNLMKNLGIFEKQTSGVCISMSSQVTARHNSVSFSPRAGMNINDGCWGGHIIEFNDINNCVRETGDHGPFNAWGRDRFWSVPNPTKQMALLDAVTPSLVRNNRIQDNNGRGAFGFDFDDGSSNYKVYQNLCITSGVKFREGFLRRSYNNIIINGQQHCHAWFNGGTDSVFRNIIVNGSPYEMASPNLSGDQAWFDYNDFWNNGGGVNYSVTQSAGLDGHSVTADPKFTNASAGNYTVAAGSPALGLGFVNFPMDQFGRLNVTPDTTQPGTVVAVGTILKTPIVRSTWASNRLVVQYELPYDAWVSVNLFAIDGKNVAECANGYEKAGPHTLTWSASAAAAKGPVSPGGYLVKMKLGDAMETRKITVAQ